MESSVRACTDRQQSDANNNTDDAPPLAADWSNCSRLTSTNESNVSTALIGCRICFTLSVSVLTNSPLHSKAHNHQRLTLL